MGRVGLGEGREGDVVSGARAGGFVTASTKERSEAVTLGEMSMSTTEDWLHISLAVGK